ncbi:hypothetical protein ACFPRL_20985 [Pseudoclavibacter helvolus]
MRRKGVHACALRPHLVRNRPGHHFVRLEQLRPVRAAAHAGTVDNSAERGRVTRRRNPAVLSTGARHDPTNLLDSGAHTFGAPTRKLNRERNRAGCEVVCGGEFLHATKPAVIAICISTLTVSTRSSLPHPWPMTGLKTAPPSSHALASTA